MQQESMSESFDDHMYHYLVAAGTAFSDAAAYGFPPTTTTSDYGFPAAHVAADHHSFPNSSLIFAPDDILLSDVTDNNNNNCNTTPDARALAASQQHKEAERRRRERINSHLDRLRTLLPCNSKTDKASLLAKVVDRVRELKLQTSEIMQIEEGFPSETDEITVLTNDSSNDGRLLIKASLCCDDRTDLIPELIEVLKSFQLSPLRAEMVTLGGRIRNVIILAGDKLDHQSDESVSFLRDALRSLVQRSSYGSGERPKRRRVIDQQGVE